MHLCEKERICKKDETILEYYHEAINKKEIKPIYRNQRLQQLIEYYWENYNSELLEEYLKQLETEYLTLQDQRNITELFFMRSMYEEAKEMLLRNGYEGIAEAHILKFCLFYLKTEEMKKDKFFLELCEYVYKKGKIGRAHV